MADTEQLVEDFDIQLFTVSAAVSRLSHLIFSNFNTLLSLGAQISNGERVICGDWLPLTPRIEV